MGVGEGRGEGVGTGCSRCILVLFNLIFMLLGLVILAAGVLALVFAPAVQEVVDGLLSDLPSTLSGLGTLQGGTMPTTTDGVVDVAELLDKAAIPLIIVGSILFVLSFIGCCGACCNVKGCLVVYAAIMIILLLVQTVGVALLFSGALDGILMKPLEDSLGKYKGASYFDVDSLLWTFTMFQFQCCGLNGPEDWRNQTVWSRQYTYTDPNTGLSMDYVMEVPFPCCHTNGTFPDFEGIDESCVIDGPHETNSHTIGCWQAIRDDIKKYELPVLGVLIGVLVIQAIVIALALGAACCDDKKVRPV